MAAENSGVDGLGRRDGGGGELAVPELCGGEDSASGAEAALAPVAGGHDGFGFDAKRPFVADSINSDLAMIAAVLGDMQKYGINMPKVLEDPGNESECEKLSTYFDKWVPGAGDGSKADAMQPGGKAGKEGWEKDFEKLVGNSMFDARGSLGQKWQKQKSAMTSLSDQYDKCVGRPAQQAFKLAWAKEEYEKVQKAKTHSQTWRLVDTTRGEYLSFGMLVKREGGWKDSSAISAATRYCQKACVMGKPWTVWNAMTERYDYLYISKLFVQDFEQSWSSFTTWTKSEGSEPDARANASGSGQGQKRIADGAGEPAGTSTGSGTAASTAGPSKKQKTNDGAKPSGNENKGGDSGKKEKKEVDKLLADATKWKMKFTSALAGIVNLENQILHNPMWEWARNDQQSKEINTRKKDVEKFHGNAFVKNLLAMDSAYMKANFDEKFVLAECRKLAADESVDRLVRFVSRLKKMHNTAQKSKSP